MLHERIQQDLVIALKAHNSKTVSVLRFLQSAIKNKEIEKQQVLSDDDVTGIIRKQIKELDDAKILFEKGGRTDLVSENKDQMTILQAYLPTEISDDELQLEIKNLIEKNKELYEKTPKAIIGVCMNALRSKASPARIMQVLSTKLN